MKYFIIAGEHSGDMYGELLVKELKKQDKDAIIVGIGGDKMKGAGVELIQHINNLAIMGITHILPKLITLFKTFSLCKKFLKELDPHVIILIDYSGFNLRIAKMAKKANRKIVYYIPPKVWAWGENRINKIKKYIDKVLVILPFEKEVYTQHNIPCVYVGNPLIDIFTHTEHIPLKLTNKNIVAVMPGSRKQEVTIMLPIMLSVAKYFPDFIFVIIKASNLDDTIYQPIIKKAIRNSKNIFSVRNLEHAIITNSEAAIVKSGTSTLQVALCTIPQIVCYKTSPLNAFIMRRVLKTKYISLPNLILNKPALVELIQEDVTELNIKKHLNNILLNKKPYNRIQLMSHYKKIAQLLDLSKNASLNVANEILSLISPSLTTPQPQINKKFEHKK